MLSTLQGLVLCVIWTMTPSLWDQGCQVHIDNKHEEVKTLLNEQGTFDAKIGHILQPPS